jgi:hypothetical protein
MRSGRLDAHVTVRWILAECAAILAVLLWGRLPFITYTSVLGDRELLVVLAVIFFGLVAFLMLDCLARISTHTYQIKRLTQELALLRESTRKQSNSALLRDDLAPQRNDIASGGERKRDAMRDALLAIWIVACICIYLLQIKGLYPSFLVRFFTANYLQ